MKNVWQQEPERETPKRNTVDLSFRNNLSMKIGKIYPVMCREVIPGDTFHIKSSFGLSLMPMAFPIQTPLRAHLSFYYVRNRNLWVNWKKFLRNKGQVSPGAFPYISGSQSHLKELFKTGGLADYLGCPTARNAQFTDVNKGGSPISFNPSGSSSLNRVISYMSTAITKSHFIERHYLLPAYMAPFEHEEQNLVMVMSDTSVFGGVYGMNNNTTCQLTVQLPTGVTTPADTTVPYYIALFQDDVPTTVQNGIDYPNPLADDDSHFAQSPSWKHSRLLAVSSSTVNFTWSSSDNSYYYDNSNQVKLHSVGMITDGSGVDTPLDDIWNVESDKGLYFALLSPAADGTNIKDNHHFLVTGIYLKNLGNNVYIDDSSAYTSGALPISALPFRAYESIYNALYRNTQNDPFKINGVEEYDKFVTNDGDGADTTDYHLFDAYWEKDCFTQSYQSPQQGNAPLLGLSSTTTPPSSLSSSYLMRYTSEDGTSHNLRVRENSGKLEFSPLTSLTPDLQGDLEALNSATQFGISINDLRNVNSLQHWLEHALMNGYKYRDIIRAHFNIELSLKELEMPEFLGGKSEWINITPVTQMSESGSTPQGWQTGQGSLFSEMEHNISKYCDEHGFIIATLTVVPVPVYQQLLPKFFTKFGVLDYYSPEFAHIGLQGIKYKEICPLETLAAGDSIEDVFAYQRPWYDYLSSFDEAHGQFRDTLSGFLMTRLFSGKPVLGADFLKVDHETTDNVFVVTAGDDDKIFGQVCFDVKAERPIPLFYTPKLE